MVRDGLSASVGLALLFDSLFRQAGEVQIEEKIRFVVFGKRIKTVMLLPKYIKMKYTK